METFIYRTLNFSSRTKDASKIFTLGPFAAALSIILFGAELKSRLNYDLEAFATNKPAVSLYRGLKLTRKEVEQYIRNIGQFINMNGYSSTSMK